MLVRQSDHNFPLSLLLWLQIEGARPPWYVNF